MSAAGPLSPSSSFSSSGNSPYPPQSGLRCKLFASPSFNSPASPINGRSLTHEIEPKSLFGDLSHSSEEMGSPIKRMKRNDDFGLDHENQDPSTTQKVIVTWNDCEFNKLSLCPDYWTEKALETRPLIKAFGSKVRVFRDNNPHLDTYEAFAPAIKEHLFNEGFKSIPSERAIYLSEVDRVKYLANLVINGRKELEIERLDGTPVRGKNIPFVISPDHKFYVLPNEDENKKEISNEPQFQHSSVLCGGDVLMAGKMSTERYRNKVEFVSGQSGHYKPTPFDVGTFVNFVVGKGADVSSFNIQTINLNVDNSGWDDEEETVDTVSFLNSTVKQASGWDSTMIFSPQ